MRVTQEMIEAFDGAFGGSPSGVRAMRIRAGLEAVFRLIDPVPEEIKTIVDSDGDAPPSR